MNKFEIYRDDGDWRWRLMIGGEIIAESSEDYTDKDDCELAIELVKEHAHDATLEEKQTV